MITDTSVSHCAVHSKCSASPKLTLPLTPDPYTHTLMSALA